MTFLKTICIRLADTHIPGTMLVMVSFVELFVLH